MGEQDLSYQIAIAGTGSIAKGCAALLYSRGHKPVLWSPTGNGAKSFKQDAGEDGLLCAKGAVNEAFALEVLSDVSTVINGADVILIAVPAYGHKAVFDAIAPHVTNNQTIIISSHASFGALYISQLLTHRGIQANIIAWGTTIVSGSSNSPANVMVNTIRDQVDIATVPQSNAERGKALCTSLFGDNFVIRDGLIAISLSNLNPQNHLGIALCNLTRMERGEVWAQSQNVTSTVGRLLEALDKERLAIAAAVGVQVRTIFEHFHLSFHIKKDSIANMNQAIFDNGSSAFGPKTTDSRYVLEDVPFGLVPTAMLGQLVGKPAVLHEAGIVLMGGLYGRDFMQENDLIQALNLDEMSLAELKDFAKTSVFTSGK